MFSNSDYVKAIFDVRSFSKAAERMHISQPSLSATIKHIEELIGYPLFDRSTKPIGVTECGKKYLETALKIDELENDFIQYVNDLKELKIGELSLGGTTLFSSFVLPPMVQRFKERFPSIDISLLEADAQTLSGLVKNGKLDIIIGNSIQDTEEFVLTALKKEYLLLVVPASYSVNQNLKEFHIPKEAILDGSFVAQKYPYVPFQFFLKEPFIIMKQGTSTRNITDRIFQRFQMKPNIAYELDQMMTTYFVSSSGSGISLISNTLLSYVPPSERVVCYKLPPDDSTRDVFFYYKKGRYVTKVMTEFLRMATAS